METRIFKSKKLQLIVIKNDNEERLSVSEAGIPYQNAGALIKSFGGVEEFWKHCRTLEEWDKIDNEYKIYSEQRKIRIDNEKKMRQERLEKERQEITETYGKMVSAGPVEATYENIYVLLRYLNKKNWGSWDLPKMTIGYSCHQYDCDGKTATTIQLSKHIEIPYSDREHGFSDHFVIGNPRGHLEMYTRIINPKWL